MTTNPIKITETERPLRTEQPVQIQREVWHLMHRHARAMQTAREEAGRKEADDHNRLRALLVDLARAHHQLRVFLERNTATLDASGLSEQASLLATIRDRYEQVLRRAGAELVYLDGQPFTFEFSGQAKVTAWIPTEGVNQPQVRETVSPGVLLNGELVCPVEVELAVPPSLGSIEPQATGGAREPRDRN